MDRREFITLAAGASLCAATGCPLFADSGNVQVVDAGPLGDYAADGVYSAYRALGFFIVQKGGKLSAISAVCTHRQVTLAAKHDGTFYCKRHGSIFDPGGHVTKGPATQDLPVFATSTSAAGHLLIKVRS